VANDRVIHGLRKDVGGLPLQRERREGREHLTILRRVARQLERLCRRDERTRRVVHLVREDVRVPHENADSRRGELCVVEQNRVELGQSVPFLGSLEEIRQMKSGFAVVRSHFSNALVQAPRRILVPRLLCNLGGLLPDRHGFVLCASREVERSEFL
jgi:hypothetical protein